MKDNLENEEKYGDDMKYESWADINIYFPIATKLVDPLHYIGMTPNNVTVMSTFFTFLAIYYLYIGNNLFAFLAYNFGYMLDCVDGKMARKYSITSDIGMALDLVSDNISNFCLICYILLSSNMDKYVIFYVSILFLATFLLSISYGLNEAIASYKETGDDNFYERRVKQLEGKKIDYKCKLYNLYLHINKLSYATYRLIFPKYDEDKIYSYLNILKHFGPGNYCMFVGILIFLL